MKQAISAAELKKILTTVNPSVKVIDVRSAEEYYKHHLSFSENLPASELENSANKLLDPADTIVCVCNRGHERSQGAADKLVSMGYRNVFYLDGGVLGWLEEGE